MDDIASPIPATTSTSDIIPSVSAAVGNNGFYTNIPSMNDDKTFHMTPDRKSLMIGLTLGIVTFVLLVIGLVFALKLYRRKLKKEEIEKEKYLEFEEEEGKQWMMGDEHESNKLSLPLSISGTSKKSHLSSLLDPGSQFSLAVQRASEIPDSPTI